MFLDFYCDSKIGENSKSHIYGWWLQILILGQNLMKIQSPLFSVEDAEEGGGVGGGAHPVELILKNYMGSA